MTTTVRKIVVIGEILVEIMADSVGEGFREPLSLTGPFPSGAPAIFIDQVARMGQPCAILSTVGNDDFGRVNLDRLAADGVDISGVGNDESRPTGSAFVRSRADGSRDFIFNIRHSACGIPPRNTAVLDTADHLHVMGSSLSTPEVVALNLGAARAIKARGGTLSFDPNLRKEMLDAPGMREAMQDFVDLTDLFLPSGDELVLLTRARDEPGAVAELLARGITAIVHKLGATGVRHHDAGGSLFQPAYRIEEIDPTGAGQPKGITSVCSAHPVVIEAALRLAAQTDRPALIEATCNQVNQDGGYTGMTPGSFRDFVEGIAAKAGLPMDRIILGGDHLGPNPWKDLPAEDAMAKAAMDEVMLAAPANWQKYHEGDETHLWLQRHFSYSDRIRYYWPDPKAEAAVARLRDRLKGKSIPDPVLSQFLPQVANSGDAHQDMVDAVQGVLRRYERACTG